MLRVPRPDPELPPAFAHNACVAANAPRRVNSMQRPSFQANHWNGEANKKSLPLESWQLL